MPDMDGGRELDCRRRLYTEPESPPAEGPATAYWRGPHRARPPIRWLNNQRSLSSVFSSASRQSGLADSTRMYQTPTRIVTRTRKTSSTAWVLSPDVLATAPRAPNSERGGRSSLWSHVTAVYTPSVGPWKPAMRHKRICVHAAGGEQG